MHIVGIIKRLDRKACRLDKVHVDREPLVALVRDFAQKEVKPLVREYDLAESIPRSILARMAELGFYGGTVPEEWGGAALDHVTFSMIIEEISRVDHCLGVLMSMPSALVGAGLLAYGTDEQKKKWLMPMARGEIFGGAGVTEPGSGTDVAGLRTTYHRDGDDFVLNGTKTWISNLDLASFFVTFASSDPSLAGEVDHGFRDPEGHTRVVGPPV